jgi:hypothetical protein
MGVLWTKYLEYNYLVQVALIKHKNIRIKKLLIKSFFIFLKCLTIVDKIRTEIERFEDKYLIF